MTVSMTPRPPPEPSASGCRWGRAGRGWGVEQRPGSTSFLWAGQGLPEPPAALYPSTVGLAPESGGTSLLCSPTPSRLV